jgi:hypothetical protein
MQDRINRVDEFSCTARPDHTVGHERRFRDVRDTIDIQVVSNLRPPRLCGVTSLLCPLFMEGLDNGT